MSKKNKNKNNNSITDNSINIINTNAIDYRSPSANMMNSNSLVDAITNTYKNVKSNKDTIETFNQMFDRPIGNDIGTTTTTYTTTTTATTTTTTNTINRFNRVNEDTYKTIITNKGPSKADTRSCQYAGCFH
jgi:hypothetical protein